MPYNSIFLYYLLNKVFVYIKLSVVSCVIGSLTWQQCYEVTL